MSIQIISAGVLVACLLMIGTASADTECTLSKNAAPKPRIPNSLVASQQITNAEGATVRYVTVLKTGVVVMSTQMACEHYGAYVLAVVPIGAEYKLPDTLKHLIAWYTGKQSAAQIEARIDWKTVTNGWRADIANASAEYPNFNASIAEERSGYTVISIDFYSELM